MPYNRRELARLQREYLRAKAADEAVKELEKQVKQHILKEFKFYTEEGSERITDPREDYLMSDTDFEKYCKLVYEAGKAVGIEKPDWNTKADYKTRPALKAAEDALLKFGIDIVPPAMASKNELVIASRHWKHRGEMLDLVARLE